MAALTVGADLIDNCDDIFERSIEHLLTQYFFHKYFKEFSTSNRPVFNSFIASFLMLESSGDEYSLFSAWLLLISKCLYPNECKPVNHQFNEMLSAAEKVLIISVNVRNVCKTLAPNFVDAEEKLDKINLNVEMLEEKHCKLVVSNTNEISAVEAIRVELKKSVVSFFSEILKYCPKVDLIDLVNANVVSIDDDNNNNNNNDNVGNDDSNSKKVSEKTIRKKQGKKLFDKNKFNILEDENTNDDIDDNNDNNKQQLIQPIFCKNDKAKNINDDDDGNDLNQQTITKSSPTRKKLHLKRKLYTQVCLSPSLLSNKAKGNCNDKMIENDNNDILLPTTTNPIRNNSDVSEPVAVNNFKFRKVPKVYERKFFMKKKPFYYDEESDDSTSQPSAELGVQNNGTDNNTNITTNATGNNKTDKNINNINIDNCNSNNNNINSQNTSNDNKNTCNNNNRDRNNTNSTSSDNDSDESAVNNVNIRDSNNTKTNGCSSNNKKANNKIGMNKINNRHREVSEFDEDSSFSFSDIEVNKKTKFVKKKPYDSSDSSDDSIGFNDLPKKLKKQSRRKWELREELDFLEAVELYGAGNWQKMLGHGSLTNRTAVNLKDKWRNILKGGKLEELQRIKRNLSLKQKKR